MATEFDVVQPPYQRIEEVADIDNPERWFDDLDADTEFAHYEQEREQRLKRTELLRNSVIVRNIRQPDQLCKELQEVLKEDTIVVGVADEDDIRERDKKEAAKKFSERQEDAERFQQQAAECQKLERLARQRLMDQLAAKQKELQAKADDAAVRDHERQEHLNKMLRAAEYKLQATLHSRKGELKTTYGSLDTDSAYTTFATKQIVNPQPLNKRAQFFGKKYQVDWTKAPQPLRIRLDLCRSAKDKLPQGQYVMMISVWNRLGGHRLQWSCLQNLEDRDREVKKGKSMFKQVTELLDDKVKAKELTGVISTCSSVSAPVAHGGLWYNDILRFDQAVYMACPAERDMSPSMCLIFELYLLRGSVSPVDKVMAWAAFPLVDSDFTLIRGCFKVPMIRGPLDISIDRYALYERRYREDIQAWLCNLYFRCDRLPKYSAGQLEYEVQLSYTGKILGLKKHAEAEKKKEGSKEARKKADEAVAHLAATLKDDGIFGENEAVKAAKDGIHAWKHMGEGNDVYRPLVNPEDFTHYQFSVTSGHTLVISSEFKRKKKYICEELFGDYTVSSDIRELGLCGFALIIFLLAFWVRIYIHYFGQWLMLSAFRVPIYQFDVSFVTVKVGYVQALLTSDQEAAVVASGPGMSYLVFLIMMCVVTIFQKYVGTVPTIGMRDYDLPASLFSIWFILLEEHHYTIGHGCLYKSRQRQADGWNCAPVHLCHAVYRFLPSFGLATILDPELTLIIDAANGHTTGDAFKLYNFFQTKDNNGIIGIVATCLLYAVFTAIAVVTFYQYITRIHRHGRIRDTHRRLTADEPEFFVPLDNEVSLRYLKWVCYKAKLFKGENGHTRRVQVTEFIVDQESQTAVKRMAQLGDIAAGNSMEEEDLENLQLGLEDKSLMTRILRRKRTTTTTYVCIHTLDPDTMSRTLYRHFMRYPSGAIVELSPKEPAQMNTTGRPAPTKVEEITYDETTQQQTKRAQVPIDEWMKENFDSQPPALAAGGRAASNGPKQIALQDQEQQRSTEEPRGRNERDDASGGAHTADFPQENEDSRHQSINSVNAPGSAKTQEPKSILKHRQGPHQGQGNSNSFTEAAKAVEVSRRQSSSLSPSIDDGSSELLDLVGVGNRYEKYANEALRIDNEKDAADAVFQGRQDEKGAQVAAADSYTEQCDDEPGDEENQVAANSYEADSYGEPCADIAHDNEAPDICTGDSHGDARADEPCEEEHVSPESYEADSHGDTGADKLPVDEHHVAPESYTADGYGEAYVDEPREEEDQAASKSYNEANTGEQLAEEDYEKS